MRIKATFFFVMAMTLGVTKPPSNLPPLPTPPKKRAAPAATTQGSGAALLLKKAVAVKAPTATLTWNKSPGAASYNVRLLKTNNFAVPNVKWPLFTNTPYTSCVVPVDKSAACCWLTSTAVGTNGIESGPATKLKLK